MDKEITSPEAAAIIGCVVSRIRQLLRDGTLKGRRIGRDWLVDRASAEAYRDQPAGRGRPRNRPQKKPPSPRGKGKGPT